MLRYVTLAQVADVGGVHAWVGQNVTFLPPCGEYDTVVRWFVRTDLSTTICHGFSFGGEGAAQRASPTDSGTGTGPTAPDAFDTAHGWP